jgi:hypothetical protein
MQLNMQPIEGDAELHGKEEALQFYSDNVYIDQMRGGADAGGRMTRKRTLHDLRKIAKSRGLEEIGNEKPEKIHDHFEKQREETKAQRWADAEDAYEAERDARR